MWSFGTTMTIANDTEPKPGAAQTPQSNMPDSSSAKPPIATTRPDTRTPIFAPRSLKQLTLFFAGAGFLGLSTFITRRSVGRKYLATLPRFYQPSNRPSNKISSDSSFIALEALNLATLNVIGFAIMATGGLSWAFDVSDIEELRAMARANLGTAGGGRTDEEAEREVEEWVAKVLLRKEQNEKAQDPQTPSAALEKNK